MRYLFLLLLTLSAWGQPVVLRYSDAVPLALNRNLTLKSEAKNVDQAQARLDQAEGALLPKLGVFTTYQAQDQALVGALIGGGVGSVSQTAGQLSALNTQQMINSFSLQLPVYTGGRLENTVVQQEHLTEATRQQLTRTRQQLAFTAKQQTLATLLARENHEVAQANLIATKENLTQASNRYQGGVATRFDVLQAEVAYATAQQQEVTTDKGFQASEASLATVFNLPVTTQFELPDSLGLVQEPVPGRDLQALTVLALDQRPELANLRQQLLATDAAQEAAQAGLRPNLALALNYNFNGNPENYLVGGWQILAQLSIPIFDGGVTPARVNEFQARKEQLDLDQERQALAITLEVKQSLLDLEAAESRLVAAKSAVDSGREAVRLARIRFDAGVGTSLELVTAQANLAQSQYSLAQAQYGQVVSLSQINLVVGVPTP